MSGVPLFTAAEAAHTYKPVDTLVLRTNGHLSILDTVFVSKRSRRAVYATTTLGPNTSLWRVAATGTMKEIARIDWEYEGRIASTGDGSLRKSNQPTKRCSMLTFGGRMMRTEDFLQKGRGWFSSDSRTFSTNNNEYKWKSGTENTGLNDSQRAGRQNILYHEAVKIWRCVLARPDSSDSSPKAARSPSSSAPYFSRSTVAGVVDSTSLATAPTDPPRVMANSSLAPPIPLLNSSSPPVTYDHNYEVQLPSSGIHPVISPVLTVPAPTLLAIFAPPQPGLVRSDISLFSPALDFSSDVGQCPRLLESLLVSAVILAPAKGEWKQAQSSIDASSLQRIFVAEAMGDVPPYTPGARRTTTLGAPITARNRTYSGQSRRSREFLVRGESQLAANHSVEDSDRVPLLPRRSIHQTSRSNPFSFFPTFPSEIQTSASSTNEATPSDTGRGAQRSVVSRPITANSTPAGDGVSTRRRPSLQVVNASRTLTWTPRKRPSTASGMPSRPISSPPPMYK